ncbi:hypothetical protein DI53_2496 [Sphingobacterium deserti]|uniref:Uncharacterized protein n=1 Tax=Sphingobacterium deserti TaxID=1229276 RepID=A0A0B8T3M1_9SPHI|nr:hypothetical protein DI53_2496 [Sphingobacterium deserti]
MKYNQELNDVTKNTLNKVRIVSLCLEEYSVALFVQKKYLEVVQREGLKSTFIIIVLLLVVIE